MTRAPSSPKSMVVGRQELVGVELLNDDGLFMTVSIRKLHAF